MEKKQYIPIQEETIDGEGLICEIQKKIEMNWLKKKLLSMLTPQLNEIQSDIEEMRKDIESLRTKLSGINKKIEPLCETHNAQIASLDNKYREAIKEMSDLRKKFVQCVPTFGRAKKLEILQMLVEYLSNPTEELYSKILLASNVDGKDDNKEVGMVCNKTKEMLSEIGEFNKAAKKDLVKYLLNIGMSWEECVHYPEENGYNPKTMSSYTGEEMEEGTPVYIVSIGYEFPNTNAGLKRPIVYERS